MVSIQEIDDTQDTTKNKIAELFPTTNSTIGIEELKKVYRELDIDKDGEVSRKEIYQLFNDNKGIASIPFASEILVSL
jgi:hypothetical protein